MEPYAWAWLRSRGHGAYLHAADDGLAVPLPIRRGIASLLTDLYADVSAHLADTVASAPCVRDGPESETGVGIGDGVLLRHGAGRWNNGIGCADNLFAEERAPGPLELNPPLGDEHTTAHGQGVTTAHGDRDSCVGFSTPEDAGHGQSVTTAHEQGVTTAHGDRDSCVGFSTPEDAGHGQIITTAHGDRDSCVGFSTLEDASHGQSVTTAQGDGDAEGEYGALDIFLTHRRSGFGSWIDTLKHWIQIKLGLRDMADNIPLEWSWVNIMGAPIYQSKTSLTGNPNGDGSCVICAWMTCIHAQHRLAFERRHGMGSFPYELCQADGVLKMKYQCLRHCVWHPSLGSAAPLVLEMMKMNPSIGVELRDVQGLLLSIRSYNSFSMEKMKPAGAVILLRLCGPMIGALRVSPEYFISNYRPEYVYRGVPGHSNHNVVCVAYTFAPPGELLIRVLDNHSKAGPLRWILFEAFSYFTCIRVDALTPEELPRPPPRTSLLRNIFFRK